MHSLYFDGCSKGNPGKAGAGFVIYENDIEIYSESKFLGTQTNNFAEYSGLLLGLKKAKEMDITELNVYGDSMLVIKQMNGEYKVKAAGLLTLYNLAKQYSNKMNVTFQHVYRDKNARADELANDAINNYHNK